MSTFSPSLRIELITTGDQAGVWGNTTNTNLGTLIESGIAGYVSVSITTTNQALTAVNGAADQSRNMTIALTTITGAAFNVYAPPAEKTYVIYNASPYAATLFNSTVLGNTTAAGAGAIIPAGKTVTVWSDGTNFVFQNNHLSSLTLVTDLAVADGGTGASDAATARTNLGLGTMATQSASAVAITGGVITGITDLAVADGGTGTSSFTSGALLKGAGTSAIAVASAADIVGQIGATAVTNATNATNATTSTTQAPGTNTTAIATTAFVQAALQALHPVGSIYINAGVATNPATLFGFGTWTAFGAGRVMVGLNGADALFDALEETGGSKDAVVVSHDHYLNLNTGTASVSHQHNIPHNFDSGTAGDFISGNDGPNNQAGTSSPTDFAGADHIHNVAGNTYSTGSSGTNANLQPYITVAMWKRTA